MAENHKPLKQEEFGETTAARGKKGMARGGGRRVALNVFDLIVILLVLVVVVLLVIGLRTGNLFGDDQGAEVTLTYTVTMTNVDDAFAGSIRKDETVYDADTGAVLGKVITKPTVTDYCVVGLKDVVADAAQDADVPQAEMKPVPGRKNVTVTVVCSARDIAGKGYEIEGLTMRIGDVYTLRFPNFVGEAVCTSLNPN